MKRGEVPEAMNPDKAAEIAEQGTWSHTCTRPDCHAYIQGGTEGLAAHLATVHGEET